MKAKLESAYSFMLKYSKITVWSELPDSNVRPLNNKGILLKLHCLINERNIWQNSAEFLSCSRHRTTKFPNYESPIFTTKFLF